MSKKDKELYLIEINTKYKEWKKVICLGFNAERKQYALYFIKDAKKYFSSNVPDTFYYIIQGCERYVFDKLYNVKGYGYRRDLTGNTTDLLFFENDNFTVESFRKAIRTVISDQFSVYKVLGYKKEDKAVENKKIETDEVDKSFGHTFEGLFEVSDEVETEEQPKKKLQGIEKLAKSYERLKKDILSSNIDSANKEKAVSLLEESFKILLGEKEENKNSESKTVENEVSDDSVVKDIATKPVGTDKVIIEDKENGIESEPEVIQSESLEESTEANEETNNYVQIPEVVKTKDVAVQKQNEVVEPEKSIELTVKNDVVEPEKSIEPTVKKDVVEPEKSIEPTVKKESKKSVKKKENIVKTVKDNIVKIDLQDVYISTYLDFLLQDKTTGKNIIWATDSHKEKGKEYELTASLNKEILSNEIIQPRVAKSLDSQKERTKGKAEVFTPSWICNSMNNALDEDWFGKKNVFNKEVDETKSWKSTKKVIEFPEGKTWKDYVLSTRLEITCGEAPFLVSRYDATTGALIKVEDRIGLLDRKLRVVNENCTEKEKWLEWAKKAYKSTYGYEFQGDNLLIARINLYLTFVDNYKFKWNTEPSKEEIEAIIDIIVWNVIQMDGLKYCLPFSDEKELCILKDWNSEKEEVYRFCDIGRE